MPIGVNLTSFADVIVVTQATFEGVKHVTDVTPSRAILRLRVTIEFIGVDYRIVQR